MVGLYHKDYSKVKFQAHSEWIEQINVFLRQTIEMLHDQ